MSDMDHKSRFFFSVAFVLSALTTTVFASSLMTFTIHESIGPLLPLAPWQQGMLIVLYILNCVLVLFITVFYILAAMYGIIELRVQSHKLKQARAHPSPSRQPANPHTPSQQQRRRTYGN